MLLLILVFVGLAINAIILHQYLIALLCFIIPFSGASGFPSVAKAGMNLAIIVGILFFINGYYIQAVISIGILVFNLLGNRILFKK
jgi:hypothetical protein